MILIDKNNFKELAEAYNFLKDNQVLTCLFDCTIGVAEKGTTGYTKTNYQVNTPVYNEAKDLVLKANKLIHPNKSEIDIAKIELSTF